MRITENLCHMLQGDLPVTLHFLLPLLPPANPSKLLDALKLRCLPYLPQQEKTELLCWIEQRLTYQL